MDTVTALFQHGLHTAFSLTCPDAKKLHQLTSAKRRQRLAQDGDRLAAQWLWKYAPTLPINAKPGQIVARAQSNLYFCWIVNTNPVLLSFATKLNLSRSNVWIRATLFEALIGFIFEELGPNGVERFLSQTLLVAMLATIPVLAMPDHQAWKEALIDPLMVSLDPAKRLRLALKETGVIVKGLQFEFQQASRQKSKFVLSALVSGQPVTVVSARSRHQAWSDMRAAIASFYKVRI